MARPPSFDREDVVATIEREFRKLGYAGAAIEVIADAAKLGRGSLYAAFGDKHQMFYEVLDVYCRRLESFVADAMAGDDRTALLRLRGFLVFNAGLALTDPDHLGCMAGRFAVELADDPQVAGRIEQCFELQIEQLAEGVRAAQRYGCIDAEADAESVARLLLVNARGMDILAAGGSSLVELMGVADLTAKGLPLTKKGRLALTR